MESNQKNVLGSKIKYYRKKLGISQKYLIARLNLKGVYIDQGMLSRIENQERVLYDYEIIAIVEALNISLNELFYNEIL